MRRANSEYVCMYVCLKHPSMHVCLKSLSVYVCLTPVNMYVCLGCLSMYVCLQACLYGCMFESLNYHPRGGSDSSRKMFSIWTTMQFLRFVRGGTYGAPKHTYKQYINIATTSDHACMYVRMYVLDSWSEAPEQVCICVSLKLTKSACFGGCQNPYRTRRHCQKPS